MAYSYPVKWITNTMRGAPVISGTAGALIAALDAFLLSGWGAATAISVTVSDGVGTAVFNEGTFFEGHAIVLISGATAPAELNGEARVLSRTNNSITFETNAPDGVATTGTSITIKYAPVGGWAKPFFGTNTACYRSTDVQSSRLYLHIDDSNATQSVVTGYESMTDVSTGIGPFPTAARVSVGGRWRKSTLANATAVPYLLAADSMALLTAVQPGYAGDSTYRTANVRGFGDPIALAQGGDAWSTFLSFFNAYNGQLDENALSGGQNFSASHGGTVFARAFSAIGPSVEAYPRPYTGNVALMSGTDTLFGYAPSPVDGSVMLSRMMLKESANGAPRCIVPGVAYVPQAGVLGTIASAGDVLSGAGEWAGRRLMAVVTGTTYSSMAGIAFVDLTGPWR